MRAALVVYVVRRRCPPPGSARCFGITGAVHGSPALPRGTNGHRRGSVGRRIVAAPHPFGSLSGSSPVCSARRYPGSGVRALGRSLLDETHVDPSATCRTVAPCRDVVGFGRRLVGVGKRGSGSGDAGENISALRSDTVGARGSVSSRLAGLVGPSSAELFLRPSRSPELERLVGDVASAARDCRMALCAGRSGRLDPRASVALARGRRSNRVRASPHCQHRAVAPRPVDAAAPCPPSHLTCRPRD